VGQECVWIKEQFHGIQIDCRRPVAECVRNRGITEFLSGWRFNFDGSILGQPTFGGVHIFVAKLDGPQVSLAPVGGR